MPKGYNRVLKSDIKRDLEETSMENWQREWETTNKGGITKEYFPKVAQRLHTKINLTQNFTIIVTGHGNIKSYLHRFKIIDTPNSHAETVFKQRNTYYSNA
jgi:hypothetical protein